MVSAELLERLCQDYNTGNKRKSFYLTCFFVYNVILFAEVKKVLVLFVLVTNGRMVIFLSKKAWDWYQTFSTM